MKIVVDRYASYVYLNRYDKAEKVYRSDCINGEVILDFGRGGKLVGIELLGNVEIEYVGAGEGNLVTKKERQND